MAGFGVPQSAIAGAIGVDCKTLRERFRDELDRGVAAANMQVAQNMFKLATGPGREAVAAAKYWLSCRAGWSEYAPVPAVRQPPAGEARLGKKDAAQIASETAEVGTSWAGLVH